MNGRRGSRSKAVQEYLAGLRRTRGTRDLEQRHLIVCEDGKSAPAYFKALIRHLKIHASSVQVVGSRGETSPKQVVDHAKDIKDRAGSSTSGTEPFDKVWCVIDGDYGPKIAPARGDAVKHGLELIVSTPCFEYWILLHFEDTSRSAIDCNQLIAKSLKKHLAIYKKGSFDFGSIVDHALKAADRARKYRSRRGDVLPEDQNPCSEIHRLIDELRPQGDDVKKKA